MGSRSSKIFAVFAALFTIFTLSCERYLPEPENVTPWSQDGYTLKWGYYINNPQNSDTIKTRVNVNVIIWVIGTNGQPVEGVNFNFGDGSSQTGSQVNHGWQNIGVYTVTAVVPSGPTLTRPVRVSEAGQINDEAVIQISGSYSNGTNTMVLGLNREKIADTTTPGWYFYYGSEYGNWTWPPLQLPESLVLNGVTYCKYSFQMTDGWNKFTYGKFFNNGQQDYAYAPNSLYAHSTPSGMEFWVYVFEGNIYNTVQSNTVLPGEWGDEDGLEPWTIRGECTFYTDFCDVTLFANNVYFLNPNNPEMSYTLDDGTSWHTPIPMINHGEYWSVVIHDLPYDAMVGFKIYARSGESGSLINLQNSILYNSQKGYGVFQLSSGT